MAGGESSVAPRANFSTSSRTAGQPQSSPSKQPPGARSSKARRTCRAREHQRRSKAAALGWMATERAACGSPRLASLPPHAPSPGR
eukprot:3247855-Prymnesium_polylepis.1